MNNLWLPLFLGISGFGTCNGICMCLNDYNRYSKKYQRYGVSE